MTKRREFIVTLAGGLLSAPLAAEAQQAGKIYRVGFLTANAAPPLTPQRLGATGDFQA